MTNIFTNESNFNNDSRQDAKTAKVFLGESLAYMDVEGQGRKQDAEALRLGERKQSFSCLVSLRLDLAGTSTP